MTIRHILLASLVSLFVATNANAFKVVENYCNNKAIRGEWTVGIKDKKTVKSITKEFAPEHQKVVNFLDKMPIMTSEASILSGIPVKPTQVIRVVKDHARFQWEIPGKKSNLSIVVYQYKGCVNQINLMDSNNSKFYNLYNTLATQP